jgi:hypothetical protein
VVEKAAVLGGDGRLHARGGDVAHVEVELLAGVSVEHFVEQLAVAVENLRGRARGAQLYPRHRRQVSKEPDKEQRRSSGERDAGKRQAPGVSPEQSNPLHTIILHISCDK